MRGSGPAETSQQPIAAFPRAANLCSFPLSLSQIPPARMTAFVRLRSICEPTRCSRQLPTFSPSFSIYLQFPLSHEWHALERLHRDRASFETPQFLKLEWLAETILQYRNLPHHPSLSKEELALRGSGQGTMSVSFTLRQPPKDMTWYRQWPYPCCPRRTAHVGRPPAVKASCSDSGRVPLPSPCQSLPRGLDNALSWRGLFPQRCR